MECKQPHYFFIILGEDSWDILIVIPCERMMIGNVYLLKLSLTINCYFAVKDLQEHLEAAFSCFANTEMNTGFNLEMIYLHTKLLQVIKPM